MDENRRHLAFAESAGIAFGFLSDFGLQLLSADENLVFYASDCLWLVIRHGRLSYELSLEFARADSGDEMDSPYTMQDLLRATRPDCAREYRDFAATTSSAVESGLARLADELRTAGEDVLRCDPEFFAALDRNRRVAISELGSESRRASDIANVRNAMQQRDWHRVIAIYERWNGSLGPADRKRLEIARRRASGN